MGMWDIFMGWEGENEGKETQYPTWKKVQVEVLWRKIPKGKEEMNGVKQHTGMALVFTRNEHYSPQDKRERTQRQGVITKY